jgi:hypothetical protein
MNFPDQNHVEQIRKRLWANREFGRASVMIGAGFSLNADKKAEHLKSFPLWKELGETIYDEMNPASDGDESARLKLREKTVVSSGPVKLATEYEIMYGRSSLDELIINAIPDNNYVPSHLHRLLLELPWSDVYTTNYDTLLERASKFIHNRKYDLVVKASELPISAKPRIVKLHGSFPSQTPFIFTEEDYRTYPKRFAPFVNLVLQSIMENTFCLIGFSGDDPNFLSWTGWVRDELGESTPNIYLCIMRQLPVGQRKVLEKRNVIPIDLSQVFSEQEWPATQDRYSKAIEWFLLNLRNGEPTDISMWPEPTTINLPEPSFSKPDIPSGSPPLPDPGGLIPRKINNVLTSIDDFAFYNSQVDLNDIVNTAKLWKLCRQKYPGWVVCPNENRDSLWKLTKYWIAPIVDNIDAIQLEFRLPTLHELNWRLEVSLVSIDPKLTKVIIDCLSLFNPYPGIIKSQAEVSTLITPNTQGRNWDWDYLGECWINLVFAVIRRAREEDNLQLFTSWANKISVLVHRNHNWLSKWHYEHCLLHLQNLEFSRLSYQLTEWMNHRKSPFWKIKFSGILSYFEANCKEVIDIAEQALEDIRSSMEPFKDDYLLTSQEGCSMLVLNRLSRSFTAPKLSVDSLKADRLKELVRLKSEPNEIMKELTTILLKSKPNFTHTTDSVPFDPASEINTYRVTSEIRVENFRPALAYIRLLEDSANIDYSTSTLDATAIWLKDYEPILGLNVLLTYGTQEAIENWLSRIQVACLPQEEILRYYSRCYRAAKEVVDLLSKNTSLQYIGLRELERVLRKLLAVLSRFSFRLDDKQLHELFNFAVKMYSKPIFMKDLFKATALADLFKRLLFTMSNEQLLNVVPTLINLPVPGVSDFEVSELSKWPEPMEFVNWVNNFKVTNDFDCTGWIRTIEKLISIVKSEAVDARCRALSRLYALHQINAVRPCELSALADAIYCGTSENLELPKLFTFPHSLLLHLPEMNEGQAKLVLHNYLIRQDFPRIVDKKTVNGKVQSSISIGIFDERYLKDLYYCLPRIGNNILNGKLVNLSDQEVCSLTNKAISWWDNEKDEYKNPSIFNDRVKKAFDLLSFVFLNSIFPMIQEADPETKNGVIRMIREMFDYGSSKLTCLPGLLSLDSSLYELVVGKIRDGLLSMNQDLVAQAVHSIPWWLAYAQKGLTVSPPQDLVDEVANRVISRRQPGLKDSIIALRIIIDKYFDKLSPDYIKTLYLAVEYLFLETKLPQPSLETGNVDFNAIIHINEIIVYREESTKLAYSLYKQLTVQDSFVPPILTRWRDDALASSLPEIRNAWGYSE